MNTLSLSLSLSLSLVCIIPPPVTNLTSCEARRLKSGARSATTTRVLVKPSGYHEDTVRPQTARCIGGGTRDNVMEEEEYVQQYPSWKMGSNVSAVGENK